MRDRLDDRWLAATLIPAFGLGLSHLLALYGPLTPSDAAWWWGHGWFVAGAAVIYGSNRALLFAGRRHADWFSRPGSRLLLLGVGILAGTLPPTLLMVGGWSWLSGVAVSADDARALVLVNVICVLFVTWLYETLFLIRERVDDQVRVQRLDAARTRAELDALRAQVDPHFLFNALNTLASLVESRPEDARRFVDHLARVYRGLLESRDRALIPLAEDLDVARSYRELLRTRFGDAVTISLPAPVPASVPPGATQLLLENAVRHNAVDPDAPLRITVDVQADTLVVSHRRHPRPPNPGSGQGLANLDARCRAALGRGVRVDDGERFVVHVPLLPDARGSTRSP